MGFWDYYAMEMFKKKCEREWDEEERRKSENTCRYCKHHSTRYERVSDSECIPIEYCSRYNKDVLTTDSCKEFKNK